MLGVPRTRLLFLLVLVATVAAACGARTGIGSESAAGGGTAGSPSSSSTGGPEPDGGCGQCPAAITCASAGLDCGGVGDGCGCVLDCGVCTKPGETCGGGGVANVCGTDCSTATCATFGFDCGLTGDGCQGTLDCGTCPGGQYCGGTSINVCGFGPTCKTCAQQGFNCGEMDDGCGNPLQCGSCPMGQVCGGGGQPGVCGAPICVPESCTEQGFDCGQATDRCGNIISCGFCAGNQICGEKAPNACGVSGTCTNLCLQQVACPGGGTTSVTGAVFAPNAADPLSGVLVYVPNAPISSFPAGVTCGDCTAQVSGAPLVSAVTGVDGTFTINNMPSGANIPLVIQNGRWRRQFTIPNVPACTSTALPTAGMPQIRMPQTHAEGDIPKMAFVTGFADTLECVLRKIGLADSEFSDPGGGGSVQFYHGDGRSGVTYSASTPGEDQLWGSQAAIDAYDMVYFACQGQQYLQSQAALDVMVNYANAGGRVFTTHYSYVWLFGNGPFAGTANWDVDQTPMFVNDPGTGLIDQTFPRGQALAEWLQIVSPGSTLGQIPISTLRHDFDSVIPPSELWISIDDPGYPGPVPMHYTFDTPVGAPQSQQCGRILYDDFHVEDATVGSNILFPAECSGGTMTPQEKMLEFMIFDLGACVHLEVCPNSQTCAQQNIQCGPAGDGCGNILQCGTCTAGQLCIGGTCTAGCTPKTCGEQGFSCGAQSDACSGALMCGTCPPNMVCLDGTCGFGICTQKTCADLGAVCGPQGDGCGNLVQCGTCAEGQICMAGKCQTPPCTTKTCGEEGFNCGKVSGGCNDVIGCGACTPPAICGGMAGHPNVCAAP